jgi:hypothetical protein
VTAAALLQLAALTVVGIAAGFAACIRLVEAIEHGLDGEFGAPFITNVFAAVGIATVGAIGVLVITGGPA